MPANFRIAANGTWFHDGRTITRKELVKQFASYLIHDGKTYWLKTPTEKVRLEVEDAPFLAVELERSGQGKAQTLRLRTNVDDWITIGPNHPIRIEAGPKPYVMVRKGLDALISRPVYYELVALSVEVDGHAGVWSDNCFFGLEQ